MDQERYIRVATIRFRWRIEGRATFSPIQPHDVAMYSPADANTTLNDMHMHGQLFVAYGSLTFKASPVDVKES